MGCKIWEKVMVEWVNTMISGKPVTRIDHINDAVLCDIISKFKFKFEPQNPIQFLNEIFPNLVVSDVLTLSSTYDYLSAATCLMIYVSFSKRIELQDLREKMCHVLENSIQQNITEFLIKIGNHKDVFQLSFEKITKEISDFNEMHDAQTSFLGDSFNTPIKGNNSNTSFDSPLQGFFQTPKRSQDSKHGKMLSVLCGDGDYLKQIKELNDHLLEEELEKNSLQEKLSENIHKCNELEIKLKDKIEEINHLKQEWEKESRKNEDEVQSLRDKIAKNCEEEKKLKNELTHMENFVSSLESDLSNSASENVKLENQLKLSLDKYMASEHQLKEITELNSQLKFMLANKEKELSHLIENLDTIKKDERVLGVSCMESSFDTSLCIPETMDVVIDKLLNEKIEENSSLKKVIEELKKGKNDLEEEIERVREQVVEKSSTISELVFLNKELHIQIEAFAVTEQKLLDIQKDLTVANAEIDKLFKENSHLNERCRELDFKALKNEQALMNCKHTKMLIHFDFIKLAHDFNSTQQRLEFEVNNIINLTLNKEEKSSVPGETRVFNDNQQDKEKCANLMDNCKTDVNNADHITNYSQAGIVTDDKLLLKDHLNSLELYDIDWAESKTSIQKACSKMNENIVTLKLKISDLEGIRKNSIEEKMKLKKCLEAAEQNISKIKNLHLAETEKLISELDEKKCKIMELESLILKLKEVQPTHLVGNTKVSSLRAQPKNDFVYEGGDFAKRSSFLNSNRELIKGTKEISSIPKKDQLDDSLEEVPVCNRTFDIVQLEEKNVIDRTFSINKATTDIIPNKNKNGSSWFVSPPSKILPKRTSWEKRRVRGDSWIVPLGTVKQEKPIISHSTNDLTGVESSSNLTKSSSLSSIAEINSPSSSKVASRASGATSFFSVTDLIGTLNKRNNEPFTDVKKTYSAEEYLHASKSENTLHQVFRLADRQDDPLGEIFRNDNDRNKKREWEKKFSQMQKEIIELANECERLRSALLESEQKRKKEKETFEKNQGIATQNVTSKYENQLKAIKTEMKQLYNIELTKHKSEQSKLNSELRDQNKRYKEHIDLLRNQLWNLGEKLLQEQKANRDLERICTDLKKRIDNFMLSKDLEMKDHHGGELNHPKEGSVQEKTCNPALRQLPRATFPTIPTEDEDEVFDNRFLEDLKKGTCPAENPEERLLELQIRNTLCLPHLKSSYPAETQFHNLSMFKESDLKYGVLQFGHESQSLTDSDHSMTRSLLPESKGKKKEQTSYKRPGPPTPSKHGGRLSLQSGDFRITPRNVLKELNDQNERNKGTPSRLKAFLPAKNAKRESIGGKDENSIPVTPKKKLGKIFRKPFGARDH